jgi:SAM-dependent methyltransferase
MSSAILILGADPIRWRVLCADFEEFETEERFDIVYHVGVLYHNENPIRSLRKAFKLLKPGGTLALETEIIREFHGDHAPNALLFHYMREPRYFVRGNNWPTWFIPHEQALAGMLDCVGFTGMERIPEQGGVKAAFLARRPE